MDKTQFSQELQNMLDYLENKLFNEFPTNSITTEYIIVSMLDCKESLVGLTLSFNLTEESLKALYSVYIGKLLKRENTPIIEQKISYSNEVENLFEKAQVERKKHNFEELNSLHLLLAILSDDNAYQKSFQTIGITYSYIVNNLTTVNNTNSFINKLKTKLPKQSNGIKKLQEAIMNENNKAQAKMINSNNNGSYIKEFTININEQIKNHKIDKIVGRDKEIETLIKTLSRRNKNNALLVGEGGCGKTSICYGLAQKIEEKQVPDWLLNKNVIMLDVMSIISGTTFRGMFEQRIKGLFEEIKKTDKYILLFDDMQQVLKTGTKDKDSDLSGMLSSLLNETNVRIIGTLSFKDYKNGIEANSNLAHKFQKIIITSSTNEDAVKILKEIKGNYEKYHRVVYSDEVIEYAVDLASRYVADRALPDSAIDIIDYVGASTTFIDKDPQEIKELKIKLDEIYDKELFLSEHKDLEALNELSEEKGNIIIQLNDLKRKYKSHLDDYYTIITKEDIASVVSNMTNIPINRLSSNEKEHIAQINTILKKQIIGQDEAVDTICKSIKRNRVGLSNESKPINVSLLVGPTGVGKSLLAKKIAEEVFGSEKNMIRIDMSEFSEKSSISKLIGTSAGYVGYGDTNQLTDKVKNKPYCVILLDEIEKANEEIYNLLLQVFDEGRLTDGQGSVVSFKKTIILMTSNVGAKSSDELGQGIGFVTKADENKKSIIEKSLKQKFNPEFLNRIDSIIHFNPLSEDDLKKIIKLELDMLIKRLNKNNLNLELNDDIVKFIYDKAIEEKKYGARPIKRIITTYVEDVLVDMMLEVDYNNHTFVPSITNNNSLIFI